MKKSKVLGKIIEPKEFKRTQEYHGSVNTKSKTEEVRIVELWDGLTHIYDNEATEYVNDLISQAHKQGYKEGYMASLDTSTKILAEWINKYIKLKETKDER